VFAPFVTDNRARGGRPPRGHRRTLDGIFWIARTGAPRRDLPAEFGAWNSVYQQFRRWPLAGTWDVMPEALADADPDAAALQMIDRTTIRAHHCAAGARGGTHCQGLGRSRGGVTTKRHADTNAHGLPLGLLITPGETHDAKLAAELTDSIAGRPLALLGDNGYDSDDIRHDAGFHGTMPMIPTKSNRKVQFTVEHAIYSLRNRIERFFNRLKNARRVATRYDKMANIFLGFVQITSIRI
jgi:transposase